jgi:AraC-like DNA-binding protein
LFFGRNNLGTLDGLCKFNSENGTFTVFKNDLKNNESISSNKINTIFEKDNFLWIGTEGGGLNKFNKKTATFKYYLKKDGLPSDNVKGIIDDNKGNLWISTTHNISKFNIKTEQFVNYGKSDGLYNKLYVKDYGLQELEFFENFAKKDKEGNLYFGGISGVYIFNPDSLPQNIYKPNVIIENFSVNGKKMNIFNNNLILKPSQNNFEITLAVHNLIQPEKNQYAYYLENYDSTWHYSGNIFTAEYFNIPSGNYTFHFKGSNNDGIWNNANPIKISIKPFFYNTSLFYGIIIGFIALLILVFIFYKQYIKRQIKKEKELLRYTSSNLSEEFISEKNKEMLQFIENKKQYLEADLSLQKLALRLNTKPNYLSQIINRKHNCNFRDFINKYRIETSKELLLTTSLKIEAVAYDSGFNTLTTFNTAFKKETGITPSKFRSENKK